MRILTVLVLASLVLAGLAAPSALTQEPAGHFDELGVWVPDEPPQVTYRPGPDLDAYRNHTEMAAYLAQVEAAHPGLVDRFSIGSSVRGLALWAVRVTDESVPGAKSRILIDAAHHGDEIIGTEVALRFLRDLTSGHATNSTIRALLASREVVIVPMVNPDGVTNIPDASHYATARKNANGVDPNRNYAYKWGGAGSGGPGSDTYRGPNAFSEPETRAIRDLLDSGPWEMYASIHSGAELILWPWGWTTQNHLERSAYDELGDRLTDLSGGVPNGQTSQILYVASGVSMDHGAGGLDALRPMTFSPETYRGSGNAFDWYFLFNPPDAQIEPVYQGWKPALMEMVRAAPEYTAASLSAADATVNGESFRHSALLTVPGKRGFLNATAVLNAPPGIEIFSAPALALGDVLQGQTRAPEWLLQAEANGTYQVAVRALSGEAAGNITRVLTIQAQDVVKYVRVLRSTMGAKEWNALEVKLGTFGLTGVQGRLKVIAEAPEGNQVVFDETLSIPDGGSWERSVPFHSGDRAPGRSVITMTFDLTGQGAGGPVTRHVEQRAAYTIERPDLLITKTLPATARPNTQFAVKTTLHNVGQLATQDLRILEDVPLGFGFVNQGTPSPTAPFQPFSKPAPSQVLVTPEGKLRLVYENLTIPAGGSLDIAYRLTALAPGTHVFGTDARYTMQQQYDPARPAPTPLDDAATGVVTVA